MKKSLLLVLVFGCWMFAGAQSSAPVKAVKSVGHPTVQVANETGVTKTTVHATNAKPSYKKAVRRHQLMATTSVKFASSYNMIGMSDASSSQVDVDPNLGNLITMTHREDGYYKNGSGAYEVDYSKDGGSTWDSSVVIFKGETTRYPNGVIMNTAGNTHDSLAYVIMCGPHTNGTVWDSNAFGSVQLTGANVKQNMVAQYPGVSGESSYTNLIYMSACDDSMVHAVAPAYSLSAAGTGNLYAYYGAQLWDGTWSSLTKSVTWNSKVIRPHFMSANVTDPYDSNAEFTQNLYAWSQDGLTGYVVFFGNLDSTGYSYASYQPIVYKTTNAGVTWTMMPPHNFDNDPKLTKYLRTAIDSNVKVPFWDINGDGYHAGHGVDATVDMNGNLHIFGVIEAAAIATPDSGGYTFNQANISTMYLYDVYTTTAGGWGSTFIDSLAAPFGVEIAASSNFPTPFSYAGGLTWGARVQASRSADGKKIFCTWEDDVTGNDSCPVFPDVFSVGIDISKNMMTAPTQFTNNAVNYFLQVSAKAYPTSCTGGNFWNIPCTYEGSAVPTNDGTDTADIYYIQGVGFCDDQFTIPLAVNEVKNGNTTFTVSANFPNPFNKQTSFNINLTEESSVSVDVFNTVGQKVWSKAAETMSPGKHMVTIDGSSLSAGIYFYRVIANGYAVTHKMVVE